MKIFLKKDQTLNKLTSKTSIGLNSQGNLKKDLETQRKKSSHGKVDPHFVLFLQSLMMVMDLLQVI